MLNFWISSNDEICPDNYKYSGADDQYQEDVGFFGHKYSGADDQYQEDVGFFGLLNDWFSSIDVI